MRERLKGFGGITASLLLAACTPSGANVPRPSGEVLGASEQNTIEMGWPIDRTKPQRLTGGPHNYMAGIGVDMTNSSLIRSELDLSNLNSVSCADNPNATMAFDTIASRSGEIISEGGTYKTIKIKDNLGFFEQYTHVGDMQYQVGDRIEQGDVIAKSLECTPNDTGLHLDFAVSDATGTGVDMERVVFVDALGGKTRNTKALTNYDGTMIMPDNTIVTADARVCQTSADCKGIINIIPPLEGTAIETPANTQELLDQYLSPEGKDTYTQIAAEALRFQLNTYLLKKEPQQTNMGEMQIETNIDDFVTEIPTILNGDFEHASGDYTVNKVSGGTAEKVFKAHYKVVNEDGEREGEIEIRNFGLGISFYLNTISRADKEDGVTLQESISFYYNYRKRTFNPETNAWGEWSDWDNSPSGYLSSDLKYQIRNGVLERWCEWDEHDCLDNKDPKNIVPKPL